MVKDNRICFTCGKKHAYCPTCYDDRNLESWHIMFDNENCKNIFEIINKHFYKHVSTEEAIKLLNECDLTIKFSDDVQKDIGDILSKNKPTEESMVNMDNNKVSYKNKK